MGGDNFFGRNVICCVTKERRNVSLGADNSKTNAAFIEMMLLEDVVYSPFDRKEEK